MGNDAQLVALLDGELDEETASRLLARIASDANLQNRYDALREVGSWLASAFDWLLEEAPVSRLRTVLQRERPGRKAWPPLACVPFRAMTFAVALCIVAAGVGAGLALNSTTSSKKDWRSAGRRPHEPLCGLGDMVLKRRLNDRLQAVLGPIRTRRARFAEQPDFVMEMVRAGTERAAALTQETLDQFRRALVQTLGVRATMALSHNWHHAARTAFQVFDAVLSLTRSLLTLN
jgi:hypothetical protein